MSDQNNTTTDDESQRLIAEMERAGAAAAAKTDQNRSKSKNRGAKVTAAKPDVPVASEDLAVAAGVRVINKTYRPYTIITVHIPAAGEYVLTAADVQDTRLVAKINRCIELGIMSLGAA